MLIIIIIIIMMMMMMTTMMMMMIMISADMPKERFHTQKVLMKKAVHVARL